MAKTDFFNRTNCCGQNWRFQQKKLLMLCPLFWPIVFFLRVSLTVKASTKKKTVFCLQEKIVRLNLARRRTIPWAYLSVPITNNICTAQCGMKRLTNRSFMSKTDFFFTRKNGRLNFTRRRIFWGNFLTMVALLFWDRKKVSVDEQINAEDL